MRFFTIIVFCVGGEFMKISCIKSIVLGLVVFTHGTSLCMLQGRAHISFQKATKEVRETGALLKKTRTDFSRLPLDENMEENCLTKLPKDIRKKLYISLEPSNFKSPYSPSPWIHRDSAINDRLDRVRKRMWLQSRIQLSSTCKTCRLMMMHEDEQLAAFFHEINVALLLGYIGKKEKEVIEERSDEREVIESNAWCSTQ